MLLLVGLSFDLIIEEQNARFTAAGILQPINCRLAIAPALRPHEC